MTQMHSNGVNVCTKMKVTGSYKCTCVLLQFWHQIMHQLHRNS